MRDARAGVTHTDARRDTDVDVAPHARAGVARERASRPGARDTPRPSSRCAVARPVLRRFHPPRAPRGCREPRITSSDRPFSPASLRRRSRARTPASSALHPRPRNFFGGGASSGAVPSDPAAQARHLRDLNRASPETVVELTRRAKSPPPRRTSRSTSRHSSASIDSTRPRSSAPSSAAPARRRTRRRREPAPDLARRSSAPAPRPRTAPSSAPPPPPSTPNSSNPRLRRKLGARFVRWARRSSC